jgi:hypothetical protein
MCNCGWMGLISNHQQRKHKTGEQIMLYQVCIKRDELVIFACAQEADSADAAIDHARLYAPSQDYTTGEAYDIYDESHDAEPLVVVHF